MLKKFAEKYANRFVSKWFVLLVDISLCFISLAISYVVRHNFKLAQIDPDKFELNFPLILTFQLVFSILFQSFSGVIRHTSIEDVNKIFKANLATIFSLLLIKFVAKQIGEPLLFIPSSILIIHFLLSIFLLTFSRFLFKYLYRNVLKPTEIKTNIMIYGAGQSGLITKNTLLNDGRMPYHIVGFIDDNPSKVGKSLEGIKVYGPQAIHSDFFENKQVEEVIISIQNIEPIRKREIVDACLQHNVTIKNVPPPEKWINGELSAKQIKTVRIEDLLGRESIKLNSKIVADELDGKVVLVTGAAGSIGSEISRQLLLYNIKKVILVDQAESPLYELDYRLQQEIKNKKNPPKYEIVIADVSNMERMRAVFKTYLPEVVYHAAAYKHVPLMEHNAYEAVKTNILGTKIIADLSVDFSVDKFVMVSTDKAVNPTNVMGASKRVAEIYTQSLNGRPDISTKFITTRFGNVLGSNGSVIPLFKKQIDAGGPITVTHPDITRYFMTIPEACQLVLEAGVMGNGGEIFIFDMGDSVRIIDIAKKMIRLSGLTLGKDIQIEFSGLRPGEKLYEELLNNTENTLPTHHPKIMIARVDIQRHQEISNSLKELESLLMNGSDHQMVARIKQIVPEYLSQNSQFESLDKPKTAGVK